MTAFDTHRPDRPQPPARSHGRARTDAAPATRFLDRAERPHRL